MTVQPQPNAREFEPSPVFQRIRQIIRQEVFTGGAVENLGGAPMGKGHGNKSQPFDINTACYMKPKFAEYDKARREGRRLKMVDKSGVKTIKSFALEACAAEHVCNASGDAAIFFGSENAADTTATTRILSFYKGNNHGGGIPRFKEKLASIQSRFDETNGALKFPDKTLFILSANMGNCAQKNLAFVGLQDGYVLEKSGMIKEMLARTTQFEKECIIYLESQGGEKDFDFDLEYEDTDQRELHTHCPHCGTNHVWNWKAFDEDSMKRSESFVPRPPLIIPSLDHEAWIAHNQPLLKGKIAGFQRGDDKLIKHPDGSYNEDAILRETYFECFHCGGRWDDDGEFGRTRILLDEKSNYIAARKDALEGNVGFNTPQWVNRRLSWGKMMLEKLKAQETNKAYGNTNDLKKWWQKTAARTWDDELFRRKSLSSIEIGSYETDPEKLSFPPAQYHSRKMTVDCGKHEGIAAGNKVISKLFFEIRDWSKTGDSKQLARGMFEGKNPAEVWDLLQAQQRYWKVPCRRVFVDAAWMSSQVMEAAAKHFELVPPDKSFQLPSTWRLLWGSHYNRFGKKSLPYIEEPIPRPWQAHDAKGKLWAMSLTKITWSNFMFEDQLVRVLLKTGNVKWENLPKDKVVIIGLDGKPDLELTRKYLDFERDTPTVFRSWDSGLDSRHLDEKNKKYEDTYKSGHWTEPRDLALMQLVGAACDGLLGHVGVGEENKT